MGVDRACLSVFAVVSGSLLAASPAIAAAHHPTGIYAPFADCPLDNPVMSDPAVDLCLVVHLNGGELVLGNRTVPISKTITLQGGLVEQEPDESRAFTLVAAEGGQTLSRVQLSIPGGLTGIAGTRGTAAVTATPELAGPTSAVELNEFKLSRREGTGLRLPIRAKINSLTLGDNCYVGSASVPILLNLTDGTTSPPAPNKPIEGTRGKARTEEEANGNLALTISGTRLVENAFAVPAVTGCGLYSSIIDQNLGLPAPAGYNTAILNANVEEATAEVVKASE